MKKFDSTGYVYIMTESDKPDLIKIGKTKLSPEVRAYQLTKNTGVSGIFKVEWSHKTEFMEIMEKLLHQIFKQYHHRKEYFRIDLDLAVEIASNATLNTELIDIDAQLLAAKRNLNLSDHSTPK